MEAIVLCVDNSEWTRNGDYAPTRWQAQADAINFLAAIKVDSHPETTVGVLTLAGASPQIAVTPTQVRIALPRLAGRYEFLCLESEICRKF